MVCAPARSIIPLLKLGDYLSVQVHMSLTFSSCQTSKTGDWLITGD